MFAIMNVVICLIYIWNRPRIWIQPTLFQNSSKLFKIEFPGNQIKFFYLRNQNDSLIPFNILPGIQPKNFYKDEVIQTIKYGKKDYNDLFPGAKRPTPMCFPTVETNKRSYGPFPEISHEFGSEYCMFGWEVAVPKNKKFNDWFNEEQILWTDDSFPDSNDFKPAAIAGFRSEIKPI